MFIPRTALAVAWACALACTSAVAQGSSQTLRLTQAFARTLEHHPDLRRLSSQRATLDAEREIAAQRPALTAGIDVENALGTGELGALKGAEFTFTLSAALEPAAKRDARLRVAASRYGELEVAVEAQRLDLLAEAARRYLDVAALQAEADVAAAHVVLRRDVVTAAARRVAAGASPASVKLAADAALARAELDVERATASAQAARQRLVLLWGDGEADFERVDGDLALLPAVPGFAELKASLARTPELQRFASEARVREARLQLARTATRSDVAWQIGVRRLQGSSDWALLGGISVPLGNAARAQPGIRVAETELEQLALDEASSERMLQATLAEAHGRLRVNALTVQRIGDTIVPALERAERAARDAYRAGALSHLEWSQLLADLLDARRERIAAARDFHLALIEIQRLTAEPFVLADGTPEETFR